MDDNALLKAVAGGDDLALRELFEGHAPWMAARLRRSMRPDAVEDVLQETFIAIWKSARSFKGEGEVGAWLWGIARRQAAIWLRKRGRTEAEVALPLDVPASDDLAIAAANRTDMERALAALGPAGSEHRELVRLLWQEGHSVAEVALCLRIPEGTVKSRAYRVRRLLQEALQGGGSL
jgi:RNA polymerase sigma-70 factor (ECF subfamily)